MLWLRGHSKTSGHAKDPSHLTSHPCALLSLILLPNSGQGCGNRFVRAPQQVDLQKGFFFLFPIGMTIPTQAKPLNESVAAK